MRARMSGLLLPLFAREGIPAPLAIWENREQSSTMTWLVAWPNFEERQEGWARVAPLFAEARSAESTPEFVTRTTLTIITPWAGAVLGLDPAARCETAWHVQPRVGGGAAFMAGCEADAFTRFREAGATSISACNLLFGALPQALIFIGWSDPAARARGMTAIAAKKMNAALIEALPGNDSTFGTRGNWETLDRAPFFSR